MKLYLSDSGENERGCKFEIYQESISGRVWRQESKDRKVIVLESQI